MSPRRQTDWLPEESAAVAHVDFKLFRSTPMFELLMSVVTDSGARDLLTQTHAIRGGFVMVNGELEFVMLVHGEYGRDFDMAKSMGPDDKSGLTWFRTPEGFWLGAKGPVMAGLRVAPEKRQARLSDHAWAQMPDNPALLAHVAFELPSEWRAMLVEKMTKGTDANVVAMLRPIAEELSVVTFDLLKLSGSSGGVRIELVVDFESPRGAQTAGFMLQAMAMAAQAQLEAQAGSGEGPDTAGSAAAAAAATAEGDADAEPDSAAALGEKLGKEMAKKMISSAKTQIDGNRVRASIDLDDAVMKQVLELIQKEAKKATPETASP